MIFHTREGGFGERVWIGAGHSPQGDGGIHLKTRRIVIGGITTSPNEAWIKQIARNLTGWDEPMLGARYLIHDRDTKYTDSFGEIFKSAGIKPLKLSASSPDLNAFAERFVNPAAPA
jgi:putative transposase